MGEQSYGPALPPHLRKQVPAESDEEEDSYGPALPPGKTASSEVKRSFGPTLPPGFTKYDAAASSPTPAPNDSPTAQSDDEGSNEATDNMIGPLPPSSSSAADDLAYQERILDFRLSQLSNSASNEKQREEWMLVPPTIATRAGVPKTQFQKTALPTDRDQSSWTDTPHEKRKKAAGLSTDENHKRKAKDDAEYQAAKKRDREQEEIAKKLKKQHKRDKSLIDLHKEKRKQEKESKSADKERKPFNRETDLQLNRMDSRQVKSVINQAKLLDTRFSSGSNKFL